MGDQSESFAQRCRQHAGARRRTDQREAFQRQLQRLGIRAAIDDEVDLKILHRRVEKLFHDAAEAMHLVNEEDVALFERRQYADEILGLLQCRTAGRTKVRAQLARDQSGKRRLTQSRRSVEEDVLERFPAPLGGVDGDAQIFDDAFLTDVLVEGAGTKARAVKLFFNRFGGGVDDARPVGRRGGIAARVLRAQQTPARLGLAHAEPFAALLRYISASRRSASPIDESASRVRRIIVSPSLRL